MSGKTVTSNHATSVVVSSTNGAHHGHKGMTMKMQQLLAGWEFDGLAVLDVGCSRGDDIASVGAAKKCGIDFNRDLVEEGKRRYPDLSLQVATAEKMPFADHEFDAVLSLVSLPYTDLQQALREVYRVMKPGARLFLTMHDWRLHCQFFWIALKAGEWKRCIDLVFVTFAGLWLSLTGQTLRKPWNGHIETWQTKRTVKRMLEKAGFTQISMRYHQQANQSFRDWIIEARKPSAI